jgi:uncharacterized repeat protein (TIGR01451 family)
MTNAPRPDSSPHDAGAAGTRANFRTFAIFALLCVVTAAGYVAWAIARERTTPRLPAAAVATPGTIAPVFVPPAGPALLFTNFSDDRDHRYRTALVSLDAPEGVRGLTAMACQRVHFAGARGVCLGEGGGFAPLEDDVIATHAYVFDSDFTIAHDVSLGGFPSRVRVSPDGRYAAVTVFVAGHSYAEAGFSTETTLINLESGARIGNLEQFPVLRDGQRFRSMDFNYWGVTFAPDGDRFYATLATRGRTYLVEGSVASRQMRVVRENVECPSASPDGTRLAFKKRVGGLLRPIWRFHVLDLATMTERPLAESRSIDDQIEWLDDRQVLYGIGATVWVVPADGSGEPRKFLSQGSSPAVLRTALSGATTTGSPIAGSIKEAIRLPTADLAVAISGSARDATVGDVVSYTVKVTNHGPADATSLKVDNLFPSDVPLVGTPTATNPGRGYGCAVYEDQHRVSCDTVLLPNGATWTISLNARAGGAGTLEVRALVSGAQPDATPDNDSAVLRTTVRAAR